MIMRKTKNRNDKKDKKGIEKAMLNIYTGSIFAQETPPNSQNNESSCTNCK